MEEQEVTGGSSEVDKAKKAKKAKARPRVKDTSILKHIDTSKSLRSKKTSTKKPVFSDKPAPFVKPTPDPAPSMVPVQPATGGLSDLARLKVGTVTTAKKGEESVKVPITTRTKGIKKRKPARKMSDIISDIAQGEQVPGQKKIDKRLRTNESRLENITIKELNELFNKG